MKNLNAVPDSYRIMQRDFKTFDSLIDSAFNSTGPERMKQWRANRPFFYLMLVATDLKLKGQKVITLGHVRAEQKRRAEEQQRSDAAQREFLSSLGKSK